MNSLETHSIYASISVIVPTRDRRDKIIRCLQSLACQSFHNFEVIVVNDGSNDDTEDQLVQFASEHPDFNLHLIHHPTPRGANPSRNEAIRSSQGRLIAFIDDDCIADSYWLEKLQTPFVHPNVAAAGGHIENVAVSNLWERFFIGQQRVSSREVNGIRIANRLVAANMLVLRQYAVDTLDEDRAEIPKDVATSARCDEEGLRIKILRDKKLIVHVPEAVCLHDHPYCFYSFCRQAFKSGRSTARLALKYRLAPRWELLAFLVSIAFLLLSVCVSKTVLLSAGTFFLFFAAVIYNELALKRKSILRTLETLPALFVYYFLRSIGYGMEWCIRSRQSLFGGKPATGLGREIEGRSVES